MKTLVLKFGGAAVATPERFSVIAEIIAARKQLYSRIVVVVSAMGSTTDDLLKLSRQVHPNPPTRELDMLLTVGERISIALLAMALDCKGISAISFTGSQSGIITSNNHSEARIVEVKPYRLIPHLEEGKVVIVAGFQGVSRKGEITTLGRGGSDTSAVALGVALQAEKVEFYKDVSGVYTADPKNDPTAALMRNLDFDEAHEIMSKGAKVLHPRSVMLARNNHLPLQVLSFHEAKGLQHPYEIDNLGTWIGRSCRRQQNQYQYEESTVING
jgi:aspartate kinase